jgi:short-subunit dehydrogenase
MSEETTYIINKLPLTQKYVEILSNSNNTTVKNENGKQIITGFLHNEKQMKLENEKFFRNKRILISGASMGLGEGFCEYLSTLNTKLIICSRNKELLTKVATQCEKNGSQVLVSPCDVTIASDCAKSVQKAIETFQGIDILILNAGISGSLPFSEMKDLSLFDKMMKVNFMGYVNMTFHALPEIKKSNGRICVISSLSGKLGIPLRSAYCSSKFAVNGFFEVLRNELMMDNPNVKITLCVPGWINTSIRDRHVVETQQKYDESKMMSVHDCVLKSLFAVSQGKREERYSGMISFLPFLSTIEPEMVDSIARKAVYQKSNL